MADENEVIENVRQCDICGGMVDRFPNRATEFECRSCGAVGDKFARHMTQLSFRKRPSAPTISQQLHNLMESQGWWD